MPTGSDPTDDFYIEGEDAGTVIRGRISIPPASLDDSMRVVALGYSNVDGWDVPAEKWMPRGATLPAQGAACVVLLDSQGDAWVPVWSPT